MVVNAVAEEHPFCIGLELSEFSAVAVAFVVFQNILQCVAYRQVPFAVLVPDNVPSIFRRFAQMVDVFFLSEREFFPSRDFISHNLEVCKFIYKIVKISLFWRA